MLMEWSGKALDGAFGHADMTGADPYGGGGGGGTYLKCRGTPLACGGGREAAARAAGWCAGSSGNRPERRHRAAISFSGPAPTWC